MWNDNNVKWSNNEIVIIMTMKWRKLVMKMMKMKRKWAWMKIVKNNNENNMKNNINDN
jgi:hypothetical protein